MKKAPVKEKEAADSSLFCRKLLAGEIKLDAANRLIASEKTRTHTHIHSNRFHITYTEEGRGFCQMGDNIIYTLKPGTLHFVYPNEVHKYYADPADPYKVYFLHFDWIGKAPDFPRLISIKKADRGKINSIFYGLFNYHHYFKRPSRTARLMSLLFELFAEISEYVELAETPKTSGLDKEFFMDVLTRLQTPPFSFPGIDELAKEKKMSRRSFTRAFRKNTGMSVHEYFNDARKTYARFLLESSEYSIKEIAFQCGYSNSQNMRRSLANRKPSL